MARHSAKAARKKDAKRQRARDKRTEKARVRSALTDSSASSATRRIMALRAAVVKGESPAPRGLVNLGNTCFFNAVMQCLARMARFRDYFVGRAPCPGEGPMTAALRAFFVDMWSLEESSSFSPLQLFTEVGKKNPNFKGRAQQDAHELMKVVFDAVVDEEKLRLAKVARGVLPEFVDTDLSDDSSENSHSSNSLTDDASDGKNSQRSGEDRAGESYVMATDVKSSPAVGFGNECVPQSSTAHAKRDARGGGLPSTRNLTGEDGDRSDGVSDKKVSPEKLITIIEDTVGGVLSSTIVCTECGTKSSVSEPFLDLQVPLVPKDESDVKQKQKRKQLQKPTLEKGALVLSSGGCVVREDFQSGEQILSPTDRGGKASQVGRVPPPPPPPPPPPLPPSLLPQRLPQDSRNGAGDCDIFKELRAKSVVIDDEPVAERQLVLYGADAKADTYGEEMNDDEDVEGYACLSSLFDSEFDEEGDRAVEDIKDMTAFSTSPATQAGPSQSSQTFESAKKAVIPAPSACRRAPAFISSIFGFGAVSSAPHGYKSVVGSLAEFMKVERLEGDNAYGCDECTRREKLRIAMQLHGKDKLSGTDLKASRANCPDEAIEDPVSSNGRESRDGEVSSSRVRPHNNGTEISHRDGNPETGSDYGHSGDGSPLMSSPVTSSESSSGVSSEDDGELVIEEELEHPSGLSRTRRKAMPREEEDRIVKELDVKVPTVRSTAEKRFIVQRAPNSLVFQLKRFTQVGFRGNPRKISGHVAFPLELDFSDFIEDDCLQESTDMASSKHDVFRRKRSALPLANGSKLQPCQYVLTGVCVHGGSLSGGHYTAYVREGVDSDSRGGWYFCNDSRIQRASVKDVLSSEAYLLYYERVAS